MEGSQQQRGLERAEMHLTAALRKCNKEQQSKIEGKIAMLEIVIAAHEPVVSAEADAVKPQQHNMADTAVSSATAIYVDQPVMPSPVRHWLMVRGRSGSSGVMGMERETFSKQLLLSELFYSERRINEGCTGVIRKRVRCASNVQAVCEQCAGKSGATRQHIAQGRISTSTICDHAAMQAVINSNVGLKVMAGVTYPG